MLKEKSVIYERPGYSDQKSNEKKSDPTVDSNLSEREKLKFHILDLSNQIAHLHALTVTKDEIYFGLQELKSLPPSGDFKEQSFGFFHDMNSALAEISAKISEIENFLLRM